tara:strand:+ start:82231 stop:82560 length:330 start_codon:yes stop_codon:yes gene_type:complete
MRLTKLLYAATVVTALTACDFNEGPMEEAGEEVDETYQEALTEVEETAEEMTERLEESREEARKIMQESKRETQAVMRDTADALDENLNEKQTTPAPEQDSPAPAKTTP